MATGSISSIALPNSSTYALVDSGLRSLAGVLSGSGSNAIGVSENYFRPTVKVFDAAPERTDLSVVKLSADDYHELVVNGEALSNVIYVVEDDNVNAYGRQVKNVANPTDLSDAATKGYVDSNFQPAGSYLTAVPDAYKTYAATLSSLSSTYSLTSHNHDSAYKPKQAALSSPAVSGNAVSFIDTITQDANGIITATKKNVLSATTSQAGIVQLNNTLTSTSTTQAATANAVKTLNDSVLHTTGDETAAGQKTFSDAFTVGTRKSGTIGTKSFAYGLNNLASGEGSFAGGQNSVASQYGAHAEGYGVSATGYMSYAIGQCTLASGYTSYAEGYSTKATSGQTHAEGAGTVAAGQDSHAENNQTSAIGQNSHAEGQFTYAEGNNSHTEGQQVSAIGSAAHAEGGQTKASGDASHAEGQYTLASAYGAHAEGSYTSAIQYVAHAEGQGTLASGYVSHAEGYYTSATNDHTHTEGQYTIAQNTNEHAQGAYNFSNAGNQLSSKTLDSVGIGDHTSNRKNATEVMQNGDAYFLGVGGYDGTNAVSATSKPLAAVLSAKVDIDSLGYALSTVIGTLSSGSYVYDVADRTMTTIGINQSTTPVIVHLPDAGNGARDFILRIEISSSTAPTFTFTNTAGLDFESEDDDWAVMQPGVNLISFTETKR